MSIQNSLFVHENDFPITHPLRPVALSGGVTWVMFAVAVGVVAWLCQPFVERSLLVLWLTVAVVFLLLWIAAVVTLIVRKPAAQELVRIWGVAAKFIIIGSHGIIFMASWLLLKPCSPSTRSILFAMFIVCAPIQIIASPENSWTHRLGAAITYSSLALWFGWPGPEQNQPLMIFSITIGLGIIFLADVIPKSFRTVVTERLASDSMARQLAIANAHIAAERDAKTQFIASASHDLGQPLQAAALFFDQYVHAPNSAAQARAAEGVRAAFASSEQLLSHMLDYLRLEADQVKPQLSRVNIGSILLRLIDQYNPSAEKANTAIIFRAGRYALVADPYLLSRALGNLIDNAIKHSHSSRILVAARKHNQNLRLWVIDDGVGINSGDAGRVFDDYYCGPGSISAKRNGFGLGLASVSRIARLFGGNAGLDLRWKNGAAFYIEFLPVGGNVFGCSQRHKERIREVQ